jgi:cell division septum initiation protein DivIVA
VTQNGTRLYGSRVVAGQGIAEPSEYHAMVAQAQSSDQYKALEVLTMAQRTADEHVATARRDAERIRGEARASAEQIITEAQAQAGGLRGESEKILAEARAVAEKAAREAEALTSQTEQKASGILGDARGRAEEIVQEAEANARDIKHRAHQIYEDVVGGLSAKRESLQQQIEALERFDGEYRARLTSFMQQQMRALWVDQPQHSGEIDEPVAVVNETVPLSHDELPDALDDLDPHPVAQDDEPQDPQH